jgi:hypothetical protein
VVGPLESNYLKGQGFSPKVVVCPEDNRQINSLDLLLSPLQTHGQERSARFGLILGAGEVEPMPRFLRARGVAATWCRSPLAYM